MTPEGVYQLKVVFFLRKIYFAYSQIYSNESETGPRLNFHVLLMLNRLK